MGIVGVCREIETGIASSGESPFMLGEYFYSV